MAEKWHYITREDGSEELYDLDKDPMEWKNLAGEKSPEFKQVKAHLRTFIQKGYRHDDQAAKARHGISPVRIDWGSPPVLALRHRTGSPEDGHANRRLEDPRRRTAHAV